MKINSNTLYNSKHRSEEKVVNLFSGSAYNTNRDNNKYHESQTFKRGDNMDNNKLLEMYISKVNQDQVDLKQDMRESEKRIENHVIASEKRMEERFNRIQDLIEAQNAKIDKVDDKIDSVKDDIHKTTIEQYRFWIGLVISIVIGVAGIIVTLIK